jgi:hypothetical protein
LDFRRIEIDEFIESLLGKQSETFSITLLISVCQTLPETGRLRGGEDVKKR